MINRIGVIFDFDETLTSDSTSCFLESLGLDVQKFWKNEVNPLYQKQGWDPIPAYLYKMIEFSKSSVKNRITQKKLSEFGKKVKFFNGVQNIFRQLEQSAKEVNNTVEVDFFLISSGIREILMNTKVTKYFKDIWACDFEYNSKGEIVFPKNIVSFTDKTRYLFQISKGIFGPDSRLNPFEVNKKVKTEDLYIPFNQMIIVGDGYTDIPLFSLITRTGGKAIAVYNPEDKRKWPRAWGFVEEKRVSNLVPADYGKKHALNHILTMAVQNLASKLQLDDTIYQR
ncbi:MAG: haloacid dehalogenase-like hydrolase [Candidatus Omnitrophica bacterium]|nr:haloacid dehalogenase-like hydrolase [Candidatus Omnitrophota bacterium]